MHLHIIPLGATEDGHPLHLFSFSFFLLSFLMYPDVCALCVLIVIIIVLYEGKPYTSFMLVYFSIPSKKKENGICIYYVYTQEMSSVELVESVLVVCRLVSVRGY